MESEGMRFNSSWGLRIFFFVPRSWQDEKHLSLNWTCLSLQPLPTKQSQGKSKIIHKTYSKQMLWTMFTWFSKTSPSNTKALVIIFCLPLADSMCIVSERAVQKTHFNFYMVEKATVDLFNFSRSCWWSPHQEHEPLHYSRYMSSQFFVSMSFFVCVKIGLIPLLRIVMPYFHDMISIQDNNLIGVCIPLCCDPVGARYIP